MGFLKFMGHRVLGIFLLVFGLAWLIFGVFSNGWISVLGFLAMIASIYFLKSPVHSKKN